MPVDALRVVLGDQLSLGLTALQGGDKRRDIILMMEVAEEATYARHHKKKIAFVFAAMRAFARELSAQGWSVDYVALDDPANTGSFSLEQNVRERQIWAIARRPATIRDWLSRSSRAVGNAAGASARHRRRTSFAIAARTAFDAPLKACELRGTGLQAPQCALTPRVRSSRHRRLNLHRAKFCRRKSLARVKIQQSQVTVFADFFVDEFNASH